MSFMLGIADEMLKLAGADGKCSQCGYTGPVPPGSVCPKCGGKMAVVQEDGEDQKKDKAEGSSPGAGGAQGQGE